MAAPTIGDREAADKSFVGDRGAAKGAMRPRFALRGISQKCFAFGMNHRLAAHDLNLRFMICAEMRIEERRPRRFVSSHKSQ